MLGRMVPGVLALDGRADMALVQPKQIQGLDYQLSVVQRNLARGVQDLNTNLEKTDAALAGVTARLSGISIAQGALFFASFADTDTFVINHNFGRPAQGAFVVSALDPGISTLYSVFTLGVVSQTNPNSQLFMVGYVSTPLVLIQVTVWVF